MDPWLEYPNHYQMCRACNGTGSITCSICAGRGMRYETHYDYGRDGRILIHESLGRCIMCVGSGSSPCRHCHGSGSLRKQVSMAIATTESARE